MRAPLLPLRRPLGPRLRPPLRPLFGPRLCALRRCAAALAAVVCLGGFLGLESLFAPSKDLWPRWQTHDAGAAAVFDHSAWGALLAAYVRPAPPGANGVARFDYAAVTDADKARLGAYAADLAGAPVSRFNRAEQQAFWINAYNAMTVRTVLAHYPADSIKDIDDAWDTPVISVEGEDVTLNDIEHRILRPIWDDPRLHYALNCASIGCPDLQNEPFTAANTETLLNRAARTFINHPRAAHVREGRLNVSSIYVWFEEDFGGSETGVIEHLRRYADAPLAAALAGADNIAGHDYDWALNGAE